jgi:hypothetical protein
MFTYPVIGIVLAWAIYKKLTANFGVFAERGVKFENPVIILGNLSRAAFGKESFVDAFQRFYDKFYNEKYENVDL